LTPLIYVDQADALSQALTQRFAISPWLFLVPIAILLMVAVKVNALVSLIVGTLLGGLFAILFQPNLFQEIALAQSVQADSSFLVQAYQSVITATGAGFSIESDNTVLRKLIGSSGMAGMLNTVWLIISAMCFGGVMEASEMLSVLTRPLVAAVTSDGGLMGATVGTCCFFNVTASDKYLAIVVPGRMFRQAYRERGLAPENLSRTLEDSATVTSVLVPWNTCGATQAAVLGVSVYAFAFYCFFNLISPLMALLYACTGFSVTRKRSVADLASTGDVILNRKSD